MLAMEHASEGNDAQAVRTFEDLLARSPSHTAAYHQLGRALHRLDRVAEARAVLQRGIPVALKGGDTHAAGEMQGLLEALD
jgi:Flp pilus assembly protein TadD